MVSCKRCHCESVVKNGEVRGQQRYRCKDCHYNFIAGDRRVNESLAAKKALAVILYSLSKASFSMLGRLFGVSRTLTYRWIKAEAEALPDPEVPGDIKEMEFDEMWHFIGQKKTSFGSSKPWIVARGEPWPGCSVVVMLQLSGASTPKSRI
jgi:transposase